MGTHQTELKDDQRQPLSDSELVKLAQRRDKKARLTARQAFEELVNRYYKSLFGYIYLKTHDYHSSEDITQEVFLRAYRSLNKVTDAGGITVWLFAIAQNCHSEWVRKKIKHKAKKIEQQGENIEKKSAEGEEESFAAAQDERIKNLLEKIKELPQEYYLVLSMKYQKGLGCEEIARTLGCPLGTVTSDLSRAYKLLREMTDKNE